MSLSSFDRIFDFKKNEKPEVPKEQKGKPRPVATPRKKEKVVGYWLEI